MKQISYTGQIGAENPPEKVTIRATDEKGNEYLTAYEEGRLQLTVIQALARMGRGLEMTRGGEADG